MADAPATLSNHAITKTVYGPDLGELPVENGVLGDILKWKDGGTLGDTFKFHAGLRRPQSATYAGSAGGEVTLADAVPGKTLQVEVTAYEMIMKDRIVTGLFHKARDSGPAAFRNATQLLLMNLMASAELRRELSWHYGQEGLGVVSAIDTGVITITDASWSAATWDGLEGAVLEAFTTTAASATQHNADLTISNVNLAAKTITVTGTSGAVVAGDVLYFKGARTTTGFNEMIGVHKLLNTVTGTVQGIDLAAYSRRRPNVKTSFGNPIFSGFQQANSLITGRGVSKVGTNLLLPIDAFDRMADDMMALRRFDGSYKKTAVAGFEAIQVLTTLGVCTFIPDPYLRAADALIFTDKNGFRVGAQELAWETGPDGKTDLWIPIQTTNTYEVRTNDNEGVAFLEPHKTVGISGITYS